MRTTLNIEDDALLAIKQYAEDHEVSLGQAASDLIHRGAESAPRFQVKNGWVVFNLPQESVPLANELVDEVENADYDEEYRRALSPRR